MVIAWIRAMNDAAAAHVRNALVALTRASGSFLAANLDARTGHFIAALGFVRALTFARQFRITTW
jgi:hypothetical protein